MLSNFNQKSSFPTKWNPFDIALALECFYTFLVREIYKI